MRGHYWTIRPHIGDLLNPPHSAAKLWSTRFSDESLGEIRLTGLLDEASQSESLLILVHGMASSAHAGYVVRAAKKAREYGQSTLRLNLRGCDMSGADIYHAGLVEDLQACIASPEVQRYSEIHLLGFSLGGHVSLRYSLQPESRVRSVASLCAPLDLDAACRHIDSASSRFYRYHLLGGLRDCARRMQERRGVTLTNKPLRTIRSMREWDEEVVARRFGFGSAANYYREMAVGPRLGEVEIPALILATKQDPMVRATDMQAVLATRSSFVKYREIAGGHVGFPIGRGYWEQYWKWRQSL